MKMWYSAHLENTASLLPSEKCLQWKLLSGLKEVEKLGVLPMIRLIQLLVDAQAGTGLGVFACAVKSLSVPCEMQPLTTHQTWHFLLESSTKSNSKLGFFFCSGSLCHLLQGVAVIVGWRILWSVSNKFFANVSEESQAKHPDALEVLNALSLVSWGLWQMSCVVLYILKKFSFAWALDNPVFVGCS